MEQFEQYWLFAIFCAVVLLAVLRLILFERVTLQNALLFLAALAALVLFAVNPELSLRVASLLGFALPSNFFFAVGIGALGIIHVHTLTALSRTELRSIALTQELGVLREKLDRHLASAPSHLGEPGAPAKHSAEAEPHGSPC